MSGNSYDSRLEKLSNFVAGIIEGRDPDLYGHHQRIGKISLLFAQHIGCSAEDSKLLSIGARIHDIGKLSISEHILNKPTQLTATEFSLVKQHTEIGTKLLARWNWIRASPKSCTAIMKIMMAVDIRKAYRARIFRYLPGWSEFWIPLTR